MLHDLQKLAKTGVPCISTLDITAVHWGYLLVSTVFRRGSSALAICIHMFSVYSGVGMDEKKTSEATAGPASAASTTTKTTKTAEPENKLNTPSVVPGVPNESENALATYLGLDQAI